MTIQERKYELSLLTNTQQADAIYTLQAQLEAFQNNEAVLVDRVKELEKQVEAYTNKPVPENDAVNHG
jgi:cell division protein FtsB